MNNALNRLLSLCAFVTLLCVTAGVAHSQPPPQLNSPEVLPDRKVTFRLLAPKATEVRLNAGDIPNAGGAKMTKQEKGIWEVTLGPLGAGAYRYTFSVDGVSTIDPRNPSTSQSNNNVWSLVYVPGSEYMDTKDVPHGAVSEVTYYSRTISAFRRMHVYTPPGYESGKGKFPVFYLLHGAGDCDDSWTTVGRAGFIFDNLIAAGKAKPMVVVMPAGHTRSFSFGGPPPSGPRPPADEFEQDFLKDILPTVEKNYRVLTDRKSRAIAGLSMGGAQTLNLFIPNQDKFGYVGVYSSGLFNAFPFRPGGNTPPANASGRSPWETEHLKELDNAEWKQGLKLVWFSTGKDDFLLDITHKTVEMLKSHGFPVVYEETTGGHTWINWQNYLIKFTPLLFQ